ncbi:hypothetical protein [Phocaeicola plebeius]|uniref:hypothetical protein n=1 Tax=Phocaeicola plebeius TaxID=310297 RepID=UPI0026ED49EE|nr:hypothetical protein [Phocaeicola plebeius]
MFYLFCLLFALALTFSFGLLLLFLFGGKKKKVTKRKTAVCSFGPAAKLRSSEAQELASLKQPALLFAVLCFSAFRSETEDGIFWGAVALRLWRNRCGEFLLLFSLLRFFALGASFEGEITVLLRFFCGKVGISLPAKVSWCL